MTNEVSPILINPTGTKGTSTEQLVCDFLKLPRLNFVTINPNKGLDDKIRVNKIGKWSDHLRKVSDNFVIVRELTNGIHFHALVSLRDEDHPVKCLKGIHFRITPVSGKAPLINTNSDDYVMLAESLIDHPDASDELLDKLYEEHMVQKRAKAKRLRVFCRDKKRGNITRIINYLFKDSPCQRFVDNIYMCNRNSTYVDISLGASRLARGSTPSDVGEPQASLLAIRDEAYAESI